MPTTFFKFSKTEIKELFSSISKRSDAANIRFLAAPKKAVMAKLLVVTPKRIGSAPKRNKVRRRLKSIFLEQSLFEGKFDIVVIVKMEGVNLSFQELTKALVEFIEKISK